MKQQSRQRVGYFPEEDQSPSTPSRASRLSRRSVNPFRLAILVVCAVVFAACLFLLIRYASNILISRRASSQLEAAYSAAQSLPEATPAASVTPAAVRKEAAPRATAARTVHRSASPAAEIWPSVYPDNPTLRVSPIFYQLQGQNEDIVAWLKIDGIVEEAVVQRDNEYYLTHNALRQKSVTGALFLDENCDLDTVPSQMLIHGHNMKEGAMFGSLKKYKVKDASFYREHPFIEFNTLYENGRYVIFAVAEVDLRIGMPDFLPFWQYSRFPSADAFTEYVERAKLLSQYRCNVDVKPGDRLLTLSTCTGNDDNKRLLVMARKLRSGEDEFSLNMNIYSTSDR